MEVQETMMWLLGLSPVDVSNQVISRDRYAEYFMYLANVATTLDKIGIEVRTLQRTEIGEVEEPFGSRQVGSSTMPHKRNPIKSEQVCGLARVVRSSVGPALGNNTLWDERDLTNSSCERVLFPEASVLADHIVTVMTRVLDGLVIRPDRVAKNLSLLHGVNMAESVMIALAERGMDRQMAHELLRRASMDALERDVPLLDILSGDSDVTAAIPVRELEVLLDPSRYIGTAPRQVDKLVEKLAPLSRGSV